MWNKQRLRAYNHSNVIFNPMTRESLGEFEQLVLLAVVRLGDENVYGVPIADEIERRTGRSVSPAAVYGRTFSSSSSGSACAGVSGP